MIDPEFHTLTFPGVLVLYGIGSLIGFIIASRLVAPTSEDHTFDVVTAALLWPIYVIAFLLVFIGFVFNALSKAIWQIGRHK